MLAILGSVAGQGGLKTIIYVSIEAKIQALDGDGNLLWTSPQLGTNTSINRIIVDDITGDVYAIGNLRQITNVFILSPDLSVIKQSATFGIRSPSDMALGGGYLFVVGDSQKYRYNKTTLALEQDGGQATSICRTVTANDTHVYTVTFRNNWSRVEKFTHANIVIPVASTQYYGDTMKQGIQIYKNILWMATRSNTAVLDLNFENFINNLAGIYSLSANRYDVDILVNLISANNMIEVRRATTSLLIHRIDGTFNSVDSDREGNIYAIETASPYKVKKFDANGLLQWATALPTWAVAIAVVSLQ